MPGEVAVVSRSRVTLSASVGHLTASAGPSGVGVSRTLVGGQISISTATATAAIASGDSNLNFGLHGFVYHHQPPYGNDPYGPWVWEAIYLASVLAISPFIFLGIWQAFGFLFRHTIIFGFLWICCFLIALIVACFLDGPAPAAIVQYNSQNLQLVRGPEGVNVGRGPQGCVYAQEQQQQPVQFQGSLSAPAYKPEASVQTSALAIKKPKSKLKSTEVKGQVRQENQVPRKSKVQIQENQFEKSQGQILVGEEEVVRGVPDASRQSVVHVDLVDNPARIVRAISQTLLKEAEMFREALLKDAEIKIGARFIPMLSSSSAKFGADLKIVESMSPTIDPAPGPGNENEFHHVHI